MSLIKKILIIFFLLFPISNSFSAMTFNQKAEVHDYDTTGTTGLIAGIEFNNDGTKMFTVDNGTRKVFEYTLSTPYDISTAVFVHSFSLNEDSSIRPFGVKFNNDGSKMFIGGRQNDKVYELSLIHI